MSDEEEKPEENKTARQPPRKKGTAAKPTTPLDAAAPAGEESGAASAPPKSKEKPDVKPPEKPEEEPAAKKSPMPALRGKRLPKRRRRVIPWAAAAVLIAGVLVINFLDPAPEPPSGPAVGGPFTLIDTTGAVVTDADFRGRLMLVYFGYTYCPDLCPTALTAMAQAIDMLGADGAKVVPVFITVDPERDTPEHLKEYVSFFHPRQVGLTGTAGQVAAVAKAYGVYYAKDPAHDAEPHDHGAADDAGADDAHRHDYDMEHVTTIYLMGPKGAYRARFNHATGAPEMAERIRKFL